MGINPVTSQYHGHTGSARVHTDACAIARTSWLAMAFSTGANHDPKRSPRRHLRIS